MQQSERKIVFAPFGADIPGEDIAILEHTVLMALQTAAEAAGGLRCADIHRQAGGDDKRERAVPPLTESEIRTLAERAGCDFLVDGFLAGVRSETSGGLAEITVSVRVYCAANRRFITPEPETFTAFESTAAPAAVPDPALDFDLWIAALYRICLGFFEAVDLAQPPSFTTEKLQLTPSLPAYLAFVKGKRVARNAETKLGYYEQAIRHDPEFFDSVYNSAILYKTQTDYHTARTRLMRAARLTSDACLLAEVYFELGLCSIYLGDTKTARNFWQKALEYGAENPALYVNMAGTYEQEENLAEAVRYTEMAVAAFPDHHKAVANLGRLYAMRGQIDRAIPMYERALAIEPDDALRHSVLGGCYLAAGRPDLAGPHFARAVEIDPGGGPGKYARQELDKLD
jgi:tetratricopeptide (TPR) repeat protein